MKTAPRRADKRLFSPGDTASHIFAQNLWRELSDAGCEGFAADDWRRRRVPASVLNGAQTQEASEMSDQIAFDPAATNATLRASSLNSSPFCSDEEFDSALAPEHIINSHARVRINCASKVRPRAVLQRYFRGFVAVSRAGEVHALCPPRGNGGSTALI